MKINAISVERKSFEEAERLLRRVSRHLHSAERAEFDRRLDGVSSSISECWQFEPEAGE